MLPVETLMRLLWLGAKWRLRFWLTNVRSEQGLSPPPLQPEQLLASASQSPVSTALDHVVRELFPLRLHERDTFTIEVDNAEAKRLCERVIYPWGSEARQIYGDAHSLTEFLQRHCAQLLRAGVAYVQLTYKESVGREFARDDGASIKLIVPVVRGLRAEGVTPVCRRNIIVGYRIDPKRAYWRSSSDRKAELRTSNMMVVLRLPGVHHNVPPLAAFVDDYWRIWVGMEARLAMSYASAFRDDHRMRVEIARYRSWNDIGWLGEEAMITARIYDRAGASLLEQLRLGFLSSISVTEYYLATQHIEARKRLYHLRRVLLDEIARQMFRPVLERNGFTGSVVLHVRGTPTDAQLDHLLAEYLGGHLTLEEMYQQSEGLASYVDK